MYCQRCGHVCHHAYGGTSRTCNHCPDVSALEPIYLSKRQIISQRQSVYMIDWDTKIRQKYRVLLRDESCCGCRNCICRGAEETTCCRLV